MVLSLSRAVVVLLVFLVVLSSLAGAAVSAQADDGDEDGVSINVDVLGPPTPTPTPTSTRHGSGGGATEETTPPVIANPGDGDDVDLGGVLSVGGLQGSITPNIGPAGGVATLSIMLRNTSDYAIDDIRLHFWIQNIFGSAVPVSADVWARDLMAGENRRVSVSLQAVGQWTFYYAHVTVTPPKQVGATLLTPLTREITLSVPPFFLLLTATTSALLFVLFRFLRFRRLLLLGLPA